MSSSDEDGVRALHEAHLIKLKTKLLKKKLELARLKCLKYRYAALELDYQQKRIERERLKCKRFIEYNSQENDGTGEH